MHTFIMSIRMPKQIRGWFLKRKLTDTGEEKTKRFLRHFEKLETVFKERNKRIGIFVDKFNARDRELRPELLKLLKEFEKPNPDSRVLLKCEILVKERVSDATAILIEMKKALNTAKKNLRKTGKIEMSIEAAEGMRTRYQELLESIQKRKNETG